MKPTPAFWEIFTSPELAPVLAVAGDHGDPARSAVGAGIVAFEGEFPEFLPGILWQFPEFIDHINTIDEIDGDLAGKCPGWLGKVAGREEDTLLGISCLHDSVEFPYLLDSDGLAPGLALGNAQFIPRIRIVDVDVDSPISTVASPSSIIPKVLAEVAAKDLPALPSEQFDIFQAYFRKGYYLWGWH